MKIEVSQADLIKAVNIVSKLCNKLRIVCTNQDEYHIIFITKT